MRQHSHQSHRGVYGTEPRILLLAVTTGALIVCDLVRFTPATGIAAGALAAFVTLYYARSAVRFGIYAFIVAELSPLALNADLFVALAYQAFALLLLTAVITPFPVLQRARTYSRGLLVTLLIAAVALAPTGVVVVTGSPPMTAVQATSLAAIVVVTLGGTLIVITRNYRMLAGDRT
ncbi:MAG: hypothetical protein ACXV2B_05245 [Halobacteriota archaeon]